MDVLMISSLLPHREAVKGGAIVMYGQLMALAARHNVTLAALAGDDPVQHEAAGRLREAGIDVHCVWRRQATGVGAVPRQARLAWQWLRRKEPLRTLAFHTPQMQALLDRLFRERNVDLIQVEDNAMGSYTYPAAVPLVLTEHEVRTGALSPIERGRWARYQSGVWERFDRIQAFTPKDADAIRSLAPAVADRVRVNPFGIHLPPAASPESEKPGTVVFVGGFLHPPNVDAAIWLGRSIMPELRRRAPGVRLFIVGSDPPPAVRKLACDDITVTGRVPDVRPHLEQAAVVLAPLRTGGGMRLKVLQAMAAGKVVVTTSLGAEGLGHEDALPLLVADEAASFARAVADQLDQEASARTTLGRRARDFVTTHYSWDAYGKRLQAIYEELVPTMEDS